MDRLESARIGMETVQVDAAIKDRALSFLSAWLKEDIFAPYRPQLHWLIDSQQWAGLLDRFCQILPFGTGGRRGAVGIGPNRMNLWSLTASVQGHCEYLKERFPGVDPLQVVLAYDVRQFEDKRRQYNPDLPNPVLHLSSKDFARSAAEVYAANGVHSHILPPDSKRYYATPELSYILRQLRAHGGLNVSASHNPPDDNGGKFYDERGGQPIPPDDQIMADLVDRVKAIRSIPWADAVRNGRIHFLEEARHVEFIDMLVKQSLLPPPRFDEIAVVFTPLHGVGAMTAMETLTKQGFRVTPVEAQMTPDGQFPNVTLTPNPEVPASMDKAAALAEEVHADLVLATDPDADRLGAMIPDKAGKARYVNGNELAAMLAYFKLGKLAEQGRLPRSPIVVRTEVTTSQVTRIARHFKAQVIENLLVGFKYIADVLWHLERDGAYEDAQGTPEDFVIACEESHGILLTPKIRDKDAGGSALLMAELALDCKRRGSSVFEYLAAMNRKFGYFRNIGIPLVMTGILGRQNMTRMLDALRANPPSAIGGLKVLSFEDMRDERGRMGPIKGGTDAAARNFLIFRLENDAKVVLRPSGTEPKAKVYVEACSEPDSGRLSPESWEQKCRMVDRQAEELGKAFEKLALSKVE